MDQDEPVTFQEAIIGPEYEKSLEAMKSEMESMYTNQVWTLVEPPVGVNPIGYKWVFKKKTDMDGKTNKDDFRSQSGYVFCLNGGAVSWKSSKQDTVVDSTTEAEYIDASSAAKEVFWIKKFISELGIVLSIVDPIGLYCDNNGAITQANELRSHQQSKHILMCYHLIRDTIDRGDVKICRVPTLDNIVDPLTKPLAQQKYDGHTRSMGIRGMPDWL
ncbi:hypothetical protein KIW84_020768 [Lathyrus oleraceus]|uniref:Uncharacterized protein n=1 Tax=Pisum sativum TaxID=3888 RepID=A0A9D5B7R9_PEA|nr:hypothetical protein KIW84_020768 [Pisum sativum]